MSLNRTRVGVLRQRCTVADEVIVRLTPVILGLFSAAVVVGAARADLSQPRVPLQGTVVASLQTDAFSSCGATDTLYSNASQVDNLLGIGEVLFAGNSSQSAESEPLPGEILRIDAPPGSLALFLSGLLTLGAWHVGRSAAHWHPQGGWLPEWYHTGGPAQVGNATPFDFHASIAAVSPIETLLADNSGPRVLVTRGDSGFVSELSFLLSDPVRGPPS